jgi:hypothetical protein
MRALGFSLLAGSTFFAACTLITDVDREKIPEPPPPVFPQTDAGDSGSDVEEDPPDASTTEPDAAPEGPPADSGSDAAADAGDGG